MSKKVKITEDKRAYYACISLLYGVQDDFKNYLKKAKQNAK